MTSNRIIGVVILAFCAFFVNLSMNLSPGTMPGDFGSRLFPLITLVAMSILAVGLIVSREKQVDAASEAATEKQRLESQSILGAMAFFGVFIVGVVLISYIGFFLGLLITLTVMLVMAGWRLFPKAFLFALVVVGGVFMLFNSLLRIPLPPGSLFM